MAKIRWIDASKELPPKDEDYENLSIEVYMLLSDGNVVKGFYAYNYKKWFRNPDNAEMNVVEWRIK